ncbi:hypothetical protein [Nocardioides kribbensis]|uniref:hypothetical protein n=1 Tax=Nocardioides kribbensis TaxID=305517 RepID=UPI00187AAD70|nr:hypothetical protein [Nocardioides kribbensis]
MSDQTMRPSILWRLLMTAVAALVVAGFGWNLLRVVRGTMDWTPLTVVVVPLLGLLSLALLLGIGIVWTSRVWIDQTTGTFHQRALWQRREAPLAPPTTVRIHRFVSSSAPGNTGRWFLDVRRPGQADIGVSTPFVPRMDVLAAQLQPALAAHPELAADDETRLCIERPEVIYAPGVR